MATEKQADGFGRSVPDDVADRLRGQINTGLLGPSDRLPNERDLATQMGVSRLALRLAIRSLVAEGYLISKRGNAGGTYVSSLDQPSLAWLRRVRADPDWVADLMEYRKSIETHAARLAAIRHSADDIDDMRQSIDDASHPESRGLFRQADHRFHLAVAHASGSARLCTAVEQIRGELFLPVDTLTFQDQFEQNAKEHAEIADAIAAHDPDAAAAMMAAHLDAVLRDLFELVVQSDGRS